MRRRAVFLDRDGVINRNVFYSDTGAWESPRKAREFELEEGALAGMRLLATAGFALILVSNQPNAALGKSSFAELILIHERMKRQLEQERIFFRDFCYCFHHPQGTVQPLAGRCLCRKPSPWAVHRAAAKHNLDLGQSWMVGDRLSDIECAVRAGVRGVRVGAAQKPAANATVTNLLEAAVKIVATGPLIHPATVTCPEPRGNSAGGTMVANPSAAFRAG